MGPLVIGIDIGTTHVKAGAFTTAGQAVKVVRAATPTQRPAEGRAEHDPEAVWEAVCSCLQAVADGISGRVAGIGIASMAEAGVLVGPDGKAPYPAIAWYDRRTAAQAERLVREIGAERLYAKTGLHVQPKHGLAKILWLQEHYPRWLAPGYTWLNMAEYIAFRLTGERRACPTLAVRTLAFDITQGTWSLDVLSALGLPPELFPPVIPEGRPVGGVTPAAARECGVAAGTPVALAGHDHPCAALGTGIVAPGQLLISTGTAETLLGVIGAPRLTSDVFASNINQGPLPVPGTVALQAGIPSSGASFEWARRELFGGLSYEEFEALASSGPDGPSGLLFLPHVNGAGAPWPNPASRGAVIGLTSQTPRHAVARAVIEGACFELRRLFTAFERLVGAPFATIYVTGGHVQNPTWLQMKADVLGRTLSVPDVPEATLLGAALLGGTAAGVFPDPAAATRPVERRLRTVTPRPGATAAYERYYAVYENIYPALQPLFAVWPKVEGF